MTAITHRPLGGKVVTKPFLILGFLLLIAAYFIVRRFLFGMGDVSNMSNGYPIGTWVVLDVVIGTAFGCGGFAMALLVYIFNRNVYHPLMRPALLGGVFGYTLAGLAVMIDLGRYWNAFNLLLPWYAQPNSVIFEVALCVMAYITVLWLEFWPAFLERMPLAFKQRYSLDKLQAFLKRYMYVLIAVGVLLPTMHQSSLGSVLLIMGSKLSPLWYTIWLPLLYLISALAMGYGVVMMEATLVNRAFKTPSEVTLFARLARVVAGLLAGYLLLRWGDLAYRGYLGLAFAGDWDGNLFLIETVLFLAAHLRTGLAPSSQPALAVSVGDFPARRWVAVPARFLSDGRAARQWLDLFPLGARADDHHRRRLSGNHALSAVHQDPAGAARRPSGPTMTIGGCPWPE